jgi:hypothetical protein
MSEERMRILNMLSEGKITAEEADKLLDALIQGGSAAGASNLTGLPPDTAKSDPKWLRIKVDDGKGDKVNLRVPLKLIGAGMKLGKFIPPKVRDKFNAKFAEKGMSDGQRGMFNGMFSGDPKEAVEALASLDIDIESENGETVRIFSE